MKCLYSVFCIQQEILIKHILSGIIHIWHIQDIFILFSPSLSYMRLHLNNSYVLRALCVVWLHSTGLT